MPGVFMSTMKHEMPSCFGRSGAGARGRCPTGRTGQRRPHLLAVEHPAAFDARRARRQRREIGTGARLAEQLAPVDLAAQRRRDPPLLLLGRSVHDQRRQRPRAHADVGARHLRGAELLFDHEQLERLRVATPRPRPARREVAVAREPLALLRWDSGLDVGEQRAHLGAIRLRFGAEVDREPAPRRPAPRAARTRHSSGVPASWCSVIARRR